MVASGVGITILPCASFDTKSNMKGLLEYRSFTKPVPYRDIAIAYRKTFPRMQTIQLLSDAVEKCNLPGIDKA